MHPYYGKCLIVDLTTQKTEIRELPERLLKDYLGGVGLGMRLLMEWAKPGADALSPDNPIVFAPSGLSGTMAPASACHAVVTKSPLTGFAIHPVSSGHWSLALKRSGCDALVITGAASSPIYLFLDDNLVHFRKARHLEGKSCLETEDCIRQECGDSRIQVASIGPAGEIMVRYASIKDSDHLSHRGGAGAVMGSKKLKAIAIRGTRPISVHDIDGLKKACASLYVNLPRSTRASQPIPTPIEHLLSSNQSSAIPSRNHQGSGFEIVERLAAEYANRTHLLKVIACPTCPTPCKPIHKVTEGTYSGEEIILDTETLIALGPLCGISSVPIILKAAGLCQFYGLDPVSTGTTMAWAMETFEKGLLSKDSTQGLDLCFGNHDVILEMVHRIGKRSGIGDLLAEGVRRASASIDRGSEHWAMHVKGLEILNCGTENLNGRALEMAMGLSPAVTYLSGNTAFDIVQSEDMAAIGDSLMTCSIIRNRFRNFAAEAARLYSLATGNQINTTELMRTGERINNLKKAFNIREGWSRADDWLPTRLLKHDAKSQGMHGAIISEAELTKMINEYYSARGWTPEGLIPTEKYKSLGMNDILEIIRGK